MWIICFSRQPNNNISRLICDWYNWRHFKRIETNDLTSIRYTVHLFVYRLQTENLGVCEESASFLSFKTEKKCHFSWILLTLESGEILKRNEMFKSWEYLYCPAFTMSQSEWEEWIWGYSKLKQCQACYTLFKARQRDDMATFRKRFRALVDL